MSWCTPSPMKTHRYWESSIRDRWFKILRTKCAPAAALVLATGLSLAQSAQTLGRAYRDSPTPARRSALERYAAAHEDANGALAHFSLGLVAFEQKRFPDAIQQLQAAQGRLPSLGDYTGYYLASARIEAGDSASAARDAASVQKATI